MSLSLSLSLRLALWPWKLKWRTANTGASPRLAPKHGAVPSGWVSPILALFPILPDIVCAKVFLVLDMKSGFWHVRLDERSCMLTTMGTPFGRFRWKRLPFGIVPAPEVFQQRLDEVLMGKDRVQVIVDDILVYGEGDTVEKADAAHDRCLHALVQRADEEGLKFNPMQFKHRVGTVPFVGHSIRADGLQVNPAKVSAVVNMPTPDSVGGWWGWRTICHVLFQACLTWWDFYRRPPVRIQNGDGAQNMIKRLRKLRRP